MVFRVYKKDIPGIILRMFVMVMLMGLLASCGEPRNREYKHVTEVYMFEPRVSANNDIMFDTYEEIKFNGHGYPTCIIKYKLRSTTEHIIKSNDDIFFMDTVWIVNEYRIELSANEADSIYHAIKDTVK